MQAFTSKTSGVHLGVLRFEQRIALRCEEANGFVTGDIQSRDVQVPPPFGTVPRHRRPTACLMRRPGCEGERNKRPNTVKSLPAERGSPPLSAFVSRWLWRKSLE